MNAGLSGAGEKPIISVENLIHTYDGVEAVRGISFNVNEGEIFSFLGPNGAGKSTAINVLITLLPLQNGTAIVSGYDVSKEPESVRRSIGIVFQEVTLDRDLTVRETLEFHGRLYNVPRHERFESVERIIGMIELKEKRNTLTKHLSGGMKRRLEIGRGLLTRPRVLFLDEPTIGLDPQTRMRMWDYIRDVNKSGTTIFLTTHYMDEAEQLSDRVSIIDHGQIVTTGTPYELKNAIGADIIYLETGDDAKAVEILQNFPSVNEIMKKKKGLLLSIQGDGTRVLPKLIELITNESITIITINLKKPTMDDVFLHFTGREIREEGPEKVAKSFGRK